MAIDSDGQVHRASDENVTIVLNKAARFGVIQSKTIEEWLHPNVGEERLIRQVAQRVVDGGQLSRGFLTANDEKEINAPVIDHSGRGDDSPFVLAPSVDSNKTCEIIRGPPVPGNRVPETPRGEPTFS